MEEMEKMAKGLKSTRRRLTARLDERPDDTLGILPKPPFLLSSLFHFLLSTAMPQRERCA